jgi:hypothetical protein
LSPSANNPCYKQIYSQLKFIGVNEIVSDALMQHCRSVGGIVWRTMVSIRSMKDIKTMPGVFRRLDQNPPRATVSKTE